MNNDKEVLKLNQQTGGFCFALMAVIYILLSFLGRIVLDLLFPNGGVWYLAIASLFSAVSMFSVLLFVRSKRKSTFKSDMRLSKPLLKYYVFAVSLSVGMFFGLGFINESFAKLLMEWGANVSQMEIPLDPFYNYLIFLLVLGIVPAVVEEIFFRGLLVSCFDGVKLIYVVIINAFCFALYHSSLVQFLYQLFYGGALVLLAVASKSVIPCIITHFINNFVVLTLLYHYIELYICAPLFIALGCLVLVVYFACIIVDVKRQNQGQSKNNGGALGFILPYGLFGLILFSLLVMGNLLAV